MIRITDHICSQQRNCKTVSKGSSSLEASPRLSPASARKESARQIEVREESNHESDEARDSDRDDRGSAVPDLPNLSWAADDGAILYKTKCAACHGTDLGGKPAAKVPGLVSDDAKKASDADLTDMIANSGKEKKASHAFANRSVTPDQIKMVLSYIREAQKQKK